MRVMAKFLQAVVVLVLALCCCKTASAQMVLYDNFDGGVINPAKWEGLQGFDPDIREAVRELAPVPGAPKNKRFHLMGRAYSAITSDSGNSDDFFGLSFPNPGAVTAISFKLTVNRLKVVTCSTNPGIGLALAGFAGSFFSADASPTSSTDDVWGIIDIERNLCCGGEPPTVIGSVQEINNGTVLGFQVLGTVALGSTHTLFLQWDQPNHRFIFQLDNNAQVFEPYTVSDTSPPFSPFKNLQFVEFVPDCTSTPRPVVVVDADFDDVFVNQ